MSVEQEDRIPEWLLEVRQFLDERFSERLSLAEIAIIAGVHPVYLGRAFRSHYGCSIGEYLTRRRLELARRLIAQSEMSLTQIAVTSGFYDQGHFSNKFKKYHELFGPRIVGCCECALLCQGHRRDRQPRQSGSGDAMKNAAQIRWHG